MTGAVVFMLCLGGACGLILSVASKIFYVYEDPRIAEIEGNLAGANCGGCGYTGCAAAAAAVVGGKAMPGVCVIGGMEIALNVAEIMGTDPGSIEPLVSLNSCDGGDRAEDKFVYQGANSCRALASLYGGKRVCRVGCMGLGDCVRTCAFDAIHMGPNGYPVVDELKCVGCGVCEAVCPKSILDVKRMSERLLVFNQEDAALAPCRQTCPAEIDIPQYIYQVRTGDYQGAVNTIRERNPLLLACGRVCPHPCEDYCRRGIEEEPVSINQLKRFAADFEMNSGERVPITCAPKTGKKVAIIGGGPAGLSCAYFLRRVGHDAAIFEAMPKMGGMLRYGIPEYRLPKKVLDWEIQGILDLGVEAKVNTRLGNDFDVGSLVADGYDAIFLGVGAWKDYALRVEGEDLEGCFTGIDFLQRIGLGENVPIGKRCAVIGGGNTAIDCVRTLVRLGAEEVYIIYRRTRAEMPANEVEIVAAEHEGVKFQFLAAPVKVVGDDAGKITHLEYLEMELGEPDDSGRRRPVPIEGSETQIGLDMLITAVGQGPDVSFKEKEKALEELATTRWNTIGGDPETLQSSIPYIFSAGDAYTGASLVVEAIGGGRRAARAIHQYLTGEEVTPVPKSLLKKHIPESLFQTVDGVIPSKRAEMPEMPVEERIKSFEEADLVLEEKDALGEANRCLKCCRVCYNKDQAVA
ncbi:FAD-dependent oxidoreductase [Thermodesulfobacteriota bacterium]